MEKMDEENIIEDENQMDVENNIEEEDDNIKIDEANLIPILNLTPIYLQNTKNIVNNLIFMNLDQGHDFHDGSSRTKTNDGKSTWVDLDIKGKGFLNQIKKNIFKEKYNEDNKEKYNEENKVYTMNSEEIFGENEFIKGSLNTTFVGGCGPYGFVVIEDTYLNKQSDDIKININNKIIESLKSNIKFEFINGVDSYYISSSNDTNGENGKIIEIIPDFDILFLPFYQRVYNGAMHKLWSFNTVKNIYLIKLVDLSFTITNSVINVQGYNLECNLFTVINQIIPQYVMDFKTFLTNYNYNNNPRINFFNIIKDKIKDYIDENKYIKDFYNSKNVKYNLILQFPEVLQKEIFNLFFESLLTNTYSNEKKNSDELNNEMDYDGKNFSIKNINKEYLNLIPRGCKYYFGNCLQKEFRYFLDFLYLSEIPFIHPNYLCNNEKVENAKNDIFSLLNNESEINNFKKIKEEKENITENNKKFISKQYGFITDTSIGSNSTESTADFLIDSFNNTYNENYQCVNIQEGGDNKNPINENLFPDDIKQFIKNINSGDFSMSRNAIQDAYKELKNKKNPKLIEDFTKALKEKFNDKETFKNSKREDININNTIDDYKNKPIDDVNKENSNKNLNFGNNLINDTSTLSYNEISNEKNNNIFTNKISPDEITNENKTTQVDFYKPVSNEIKSFNNELNVETIFNIKPEVIEESEINPFVKINANSMEKDIEFYENTNANNLQLYYDYININTTSDSSSNNYFNNCWQSTDFYQKGGSDYPYKFTITSGSLDSSGLGGQSLPPYHAPEVDIYMPIFDLSGNDSILKGAIIRMVVLKEILNNPINSKSKVVVFCHFVYADFESCGIVNPSNIDSYENSLKELLTFVINNTFYINRENENNCVNIDNLKIDDLNKDENLNFILKLYNDKSRYWYKYYTFTQGPTVKDSIVKPVNFNSINQMRTVTKSDYVALGIVDVAEHLISYSSKLRNAFNDKKVLFVKLFLVRNKYTGDKSRATDTLFLNQNSYLEGVQISNDENTLYNAQMLGLNTVWSTSTKSVFYMTPYLTKQNKIPITTGQFVEKLCNGLKSNPYLNTILNKKERNENSNEETLIKSDILADLYSNFSKEFLDYYELYIKNKKNRVDDILKNINYNLTDNIFNYTEKLNYEMNEFLDLSNYYETIIGTYNCIDDNENNNVNNNENNNEEIFNNIFISKNFKNRFPEYFQNRYVNIINTLNDVNGKNISKTYNLIFEFIKLVNNMKTKFNNIENINIILNDNLQNFIVYVLKIIPYWMDEIINYKKSLLMYEYCNTNNIIINKIDEFISIYKSNECKKFLNDLKDDKFKKYNEFKNNPKIHINCSNNKPTEDNNYLKEYEPDKTDNSIDENLQLKKIEENQEKYNIFAKNLIKSSNLADTIEKNKYALTSISTPSIFNSNKTEIKDKNTLVNENIFKKPRISIGGNNDIVKKEEKTDFQNKLEEFYKNTYKCNVGNQIKYYISIIKEIENLYGNYGTKEIENLEEENSLLLINIFMKNIYFINSSYVPIINYNNIIDKFELVDLNYTVEEINCLLNKYSSQLQMYSLINDIKNSEYSKEELSNLLYDSISDITLKDLNIPFFKYEIQKKIIYNTLEPIDFSENLDIENNTESNDISDSNDTENNDISDSNNTESNDISESNNTESNDISESNNTETNNISDSNNDKKNLDLESNNAIENNEISQLNNDTGINKDSNKDTSNYLNKLNKLNKIKNTQKNLNIPNFANGIRTRTGGINLSHKNKKINKNKKTRKSRKKIMNKRTKRKLFVKRKKYSKKNK